MAIERQATRYVKHITGGETKRAGHTPLSLKTKRARHASFRATYRARRRRVARTQSRARDRSGGWRAARVDGRARRDLDRIGRFRRSGEPPVARARVPKASGGGTRGPSATATRGARVGEDANTQPPPEKRASGSDPRVEGRFAQRHKARALAGGAKKKSRVHGQERKGERARERARIASERARGNGNSGHSPPPSSGLAVAALSDPQNATPRRHVVAPPLPDRHARLQPAWLCVVVVWSRVGSRASPRRA